MTEQVAQNNYLNVRQTALTPSILLDNFKPSVGKSEDINLKVIINRYISIIKDGRKTIATITLLFMILALFVGALTNANYTSKATLRINTDPTQYLDYKVDTKRQASYVNDEFFYNTENRLLRSRDLAKKVISDLAIEDVLLQEKKYKGIVYTITAPLKGLVNILKQTILPSNKGGVKLKGITADDIFLKNLTILPVRFSRVIDIEYTSKDPELANKVVEKLIENYKLSKFLVKTSVAKDASEFIDIQLKKAKKDLFIAEYNLINYSKFNKIIDLKSDKSILASNLEALNKAYIDALNKRIAIQQSFEIKRDISSDSRYLTDPVVQAHKKELTKLKALLKGNLMHFKPKHPSMVSISARIKEIEEGIKAEFNNIKSNELAIFESSLEMAMKIEQELKRKIDEYEGRLLKFRDNNIEYSNLKREVETSQALFTGLVKRLKEIGTVAPVKDDNIIVVDAPEIPHQKDSPRMIKYIMLGLLLGLFLSIGLVLIKDLLSPLIRSNDDIEGLSGSYKVLATLPKVKDKKGVVNFVNNREMIRHFQSIYTSMPLQNLFPKCLNVTSATENEGKTAVAVNLAVSIARLHKTVLLIDTNLNNPKVHEYFNLDNKHGLSEFLIGDDKKILNTVIKKKLFVITAGQKKQDPMTTLSNPKFIKFLEVSGNIFDHIIIDSSAILSASESRIIASHTSATLIVVGEKKVHKNQLEDAMSLLDRAGATLVGFVNNMSTSKINT